ncbi:MAG TPA: GNAT family N-acetyltransferase [Polyangiales bacterium]|jgi:RimJ/RimL family protein N-acetyltransferase|nr:GNAT family N-acetyltransferase [Polyangiales bacterium]
MLGPTLETERLILRPPNESDFDAFADFSADPVAMRFLGGPQTRSMAWRSLATLIGAWTLRGYSMFSFIEKSSGRFVGRGGPWFPEGWPGTEVGWAVVADAQRRGYAKEAATAAIEYAFDQLGFRAVIHCIDPDNAPSIALARSLGSSVQRRAVRAPAPIDATWDLYGQTREQWRARTFTAC